ncbi:MAG: DNA-directed RNA polymerase subunit D [Nanoarchaeota archaeon]|jgi:DNA-directed RNA polymerase subunit D|nr:DNA-directed RNA polymerase subunit D [Nanoarchaeota archaeon]
MKTVIKTNEKIVFSTEMSTSLANAIRRSALSIPVLAVDEVEIEKNDSALYDETLAHRIGLTPLVMTKEIKEDSEVKLKLSVKKPGYVLAGEMKGDVEVAFPKMPFTLISEDQEVTLTATARVGYGKDHAKFSPGIFTYRIISEITLPKKYKETIAKFFPNTIKEKSDKIIILDDQDKTIIDFCEGLCKRDKEECETKDTKDLMFTIESYGQLKASSIFKKALDILKAETKELSKAF